MALRYRGREAGHHKFQTPLHWLTRKPHSPVVRIPERPEIVLHSDIIELVIKWVRISYNTSYKVGPITARIFGPYTSYETTLARACRVNRAWCETVRPHLFKCVVLVTRSHCDAFLPAIRQLPQLASHVRILSVILSQSQWGDSSILTLHDLPWILVGLPMLYELRLDLGRATRTNTQWQTLWYALRSLPGPAISALRISGSGALSTTDYYQLINIWPSVQFLCLRGRGFRPGLGAGAKTRCSLRLREFRWECNEYASLEFLDWLLSPSVGVLETIHWPYLHLSNTERDRTLWSHFVLPKRADATVLIHTHAPYLRSLHVPSWNDVIMECLSLEELWIQGVPWPTLDQIRALKRLKHLAGHPEPLLRVLGPPSNLRMGDALLLSCYVTTGMTKGEREQISALDALGVQVRIFALQLDEPDARVGFLLLKMFLKADDWCIHKKPEEELIPTTVYPRCTSPSSALRIMNRLVQDRSPPQHPNLIFYLFYIGAMARTSEKWVHNVVAWIRRHAVRLVLFYATTFYALNFYLYWRLDAENEVWIMAWVVFNGSLIIPILSHMKKTRDMNRIRNVGKYR